MSKYVDEFISKPEVDHFVENHLGKVMGFFMVAAVVITLFA